MPQWLIYLLSTAGTLLLTLTVTLFFNELVELPKKQKKQKQLEREERERLARENLERDEKIAELQEVIDRLPDYREQSLRVQAQLQETDVNILSLCEEIKNSVIENKQVLNMRLDRLEKREKNSIRATLLDEHRLFTDETKNPMLAWSEMEHHAFFELVDDYEELNGNDYVHSTVIPDMNKLVVIPMSDKQMLLKLMKFVLLKV